MKVLIVLSALIAASCALPTATFKPDPDIINDLYEFAQCIDQESYQRHMNEAMKDPDIIPVLKYLASDDFKNKVEAFDKEPNYLAILKDLEEYGLPAYEYVNIYLKDIRGDIDPIVQLTKMQEGNHGVGSFDSVFDTLMTDINDECTKRVLEDRIEADPKFKALVEHLKSDDYKQLVEAFKASKTVKDTLEAFNKVGLNLAKFVELLKKEHHYDW